MSAPDGLLVVDKPAGWTSHDVVARCRRLCATRKVGHAGTLDPMATGVLVLGIGRATKLLTFLVGCDKDYDATIRLGQATLTDDAEGEVTASAGADGVTEAAIRAGVAALTGEIQQVPSAVSAIKVKGERAYHRVRAGEDVELPARAVTVSRFDIREIRPLLAPGDPGPASRVHDTPGEPHEDRSVVHSRSLGGSPELDVAGGGVAVVDIDVSVTVSSGTYVRALARDLGASLGCGGHLTALRRTRVGGFTLGQAHDLERLASGIPEEQPVIPLADAARASFPARELTEEESRRLGYGQRIASEQPGRTEPVAAFAPDGSLVAVLDESRPDARSRVVLLPATS